jgi:hypothetical protein
MDLVIVAVRSHASTKSAQWQKRHELRESKLALVHGGPSREMQKTISHGIEVQIETNLKS